MKHMWVRIERYLFVMLLCTHTYLFLLRLGVDSGWDTGALLGRLDALSVSAYHPKITSNLYAYHPPLGFLFIHAVHLLGFPHIVSAQIVSFGCSILAFLALRHTLRTLSWLEEPMGIAFLYTTFSLPVVLSLATTLNLDSFMLLLTCALLLLCTQAFLARRPRGRHERILQAEGITAMIFAGMMIKFSGVLLVAIPLISALCGSRPRRNILFALASVAAALALAFPFYYSNYYVPSGTFFPNNAVLFEGKMIRDLRAARDTDRIAFVWNLFTPAPDMRAAGERDYDTMRLSDTWRDVWSADKRLVPMTQSTAAVSTVYLAIMPFLLLAGIVGLLLRLATRATTDRAKAWKALSLILLGIGLVQFVGLLRYTYQTPIPDWRMGKAIYVMPAMLFIAFALVHCLVPVERILQRMKIRSHAPHLALIVFVTVFLLVNHLVPVY